MDRILFFRRFSGHNLSIKLTWKQSFSAIFLGISSNVFYILFKALQFFLHVTYFFFIERNIAELVSCLLYFWAHAETAIGNCVC